MAIRKEQTSYTVANSLKTAMVAKSILPQMQVLEAYYMSATEGHFLDAEIDGAVFRTIVKDGTTINIDFLDKGEPLAVRMWTFRELERYIGSFNLVTASTWTKPASNYIHVITRNGQNYQGTDTNQANATAKALTAMINAL